MNINGQEFEFQPALPEYLSQVEIYSTFPDGHSRIEVRCLITQKLIEDRPDCQIIEDGSKKIFVAMPGSIKHHKLSWKVRLLRWLAKG